MHGFLATRTNPARSPSLAARSAVGAPAARLLLPLLGGGDLLGSVCDAKQAGGQSFYRLSDARVLAWLSLKVLQAKAAMQATAAGAFRWGSLPPARPGCIAWPRSHVHALAARQRGMLPAWPLSPRRTRNAGLERHAAPALQLHG